MTPKESPPPDHALPTGVFSASPALAGTLTGALGPVSQPTLSHLTTSGRRPGDTQQIVVTPPGYTITGELGRGGMGVVYAATDDRLKRDVALKMLLVGGDERNLIRFLIEAEAMAQVRHPHVVQVFEAGEHEGWPFLALEYLPGGTLAARLASAGRIPVRDALKLMLKIARGVEAAHRQGIVHRDLKPGNVMFDGEGEPKVTDFGLAKRDSQDLTATDVMMGTPSYMSPEQAKGETKTAGPSADVFALGVLLYEITTGTRPFVGNTAAAIIYKVIHETPEPPRRREPAIPRDAEIITLKCLEKDPAARYADAGKLADDLERYLTGKSITARPAGRLERGVKWVRRNPAVAASLFVAAAALVAGSTFSYVEYLEASQKARDEQTARQEEQQRGKERDDALNKMTVALNEEAKRVKERDAALDDANHQIGIGHFLLAHEAFQNQDQELARDRLGLVRPAQRGWEWHHLRRELEGGIFTLHGHTNAVVGVAFSPDGARLLSVSRKGAVLAWNARTGSPLPESKERPKTVKGEIRSPDGSRIVTPAKDDNAIVTDATHGAKLFELTGHTDSVTCVAFSPDGLRIVTGSDDTTAKVWDAKTGALIVDLKGHAREVRCVAFSPDGSRVATGGEDGTVKVWDARPGAPYRELTGHTDQITGVAHSPDGTRIATASWDRTARIWDAATGALMLELKGHNVVVWNVAFSPDGSRIVTGGFDGAAIVWDARTGARLFQMKGAGRWGNGVAFSPDGTRIITGNIIRDARTGEALVEFKGRRGIVSAVAFSPDGLRIVTGGEGPATVWDARTGDLLFETKGNHRGAVNGVAFSPDGSRIATASWDKTAKVWDAKTGALLVELKGHTNELRNVAFSPDGRRIVTSGSWDKTARVWDARTGAPLAELKGHSQLVHGVSFSPDGSRIVTGGDRAARVWDAKPGEPPVELKGHSEESKGAEFSRDGLLPDVITDLAFSPDGARIVTCAEDGTAKVWDVKTGALLHDLTEHKGQLFSVAFSPDGSRIVTGGENDQLTGEVKVWDAKTGALLFDLPGLPSPVQEAAFDATGSRIVTKGNEMKAKVWDAVTGRELPNEPVPTTLAKPRVSPDGRLFAQVLETRVVLVPLTWHARELEYRLAHTVPDAGRHQHSFVTAVKTGDHSAAAFHMDRLLSMPSRRTTRQFHERLQRFAGPATVARTTFHHRELAATPYDRHLVEALAVGGDWLAQRLVAQERLREGKPALAVPLLHACLLARPANAPPVEELLIAQSHLKLNDRATAERYHRAAVEWLDRPRQPMRAMNMTSHAAINGWATLGEAFKPVDDPRHNPFDWESWHECEVFRADVEAGLVGKK